MNKKYTIIIPGFGSDATTATYRNFKKIIGENCYIFTPTWKYHTILDWVKEYENFIAKKKIKYFTAVGFSVGAYIIACSKIIPQKTIYASMSPLFKEDIHKWSPKMVRPFGKWRMKSIGTYIEKPNSSFIVGENELPIVFEMIDRICGSSNIITIKGVGHDISNKDYFNCVIKLIKTH